MKIICRLFNRRYVILVRRYVSISLLCVLSIILVACGQSKEEEATLEFSPEEFVEPEEVVLIVNGEEIYGNEYNSTYMQTKVRLIQFRQDATDLEAIKEATLQTLIEQELLLQEGERIGLKVSEEELKGQYEAIRDEVTDEEFQDFLKQYQMTESAFKVQLAYSIFHEKYVETEIPEEEIAEEEIEEVYKELRNVNDEFPSFEEMAPRIEIDLKNQKKLEKLKEKLKELEESATIERKID